MANAFQDLYTDYDGIIRVYQSDGSTARTRVIGVDSRGNDIERDLTTIKGAYDQFPPLRLSRQDPPYFTLCVDRGVGSGALTLYQAHSDPDFGTCPIVKGDIVAFEPEEGTEWARLRVRKDPARVSEHQWRCELEGESYALFGRPAIDVENWDDGWAVETDYLKYHDSDYTVSFEEYKPGNIVKWLLAQSLDYYSAKDWHGDRDIEDEILTWDAGLDTEETWGEEIDLFRLSEEQSCADVIRELAMHAQGDSSHITTWGITNDSEFFFKPIPASLEMKLQIDNMGATLLGSGLEACNLLNRPGTRPGEFYNVADISAGNDVRVVVRDDDSIDANDGACRILRDEVSSIGTVAGATAYGHALLQRYATLPTVYDMVRVTIPSATALPLPWAGLCLVNSDEDDTTDAVMIRTVRVYFGEQPWAEIEIGNLESGAMNVSRSGDASSPGLTGHSVNQRQRRRRPEREFHLKVVKITAITETSPQKYSGLELSLDDFSTEVDSENPITNIYVLDDSADLYSVGDVVAVRVPGEDWTKGNRAFIVGSGSGGGGSCSLCQFTYLNCSGA